MHVYIKKSIKTLAVKPHFGPHGVTKCQTDFKDIEWDKFVEVSKTCRLVLTVINLEVGLRLSQRLL